MKGLILIGFGLFSLFQQESGNAYLTISGTDSTGHVYEDGSFDTAYFELNHLAKANYPITKTRIQSERLEFLAAYGKAADREAKDSILDAAGRHFENALMNHIVPFWYGTPWSFEGHTSKPKVGEVACGYFVSTTLLHAGVNVNRYRLAQQDPKHEALSIANGSINSFSGLNSMEFKDTFQKTFSEGLYFIGLDNHVGYVLLRKGELFFIHSNYIGASGVTVEPVQYAQAFNSSVYHVSPISRNRNLILKWLNGSEVVVRTP